MLRRIILGFGANAFGQAVTIAIQIFSVTLFLKFWDDATYGVWLLLAAIPGYVGMADVGMVSASGNRMTMAMGRGDVAEANRVYQSAQLFMCVVCGGLALLLVPAALFGPAPGDMTADMRVALATLLVGVLVSLLGGLSEAVFRATGRYPVGSMLGQISRLLEFCGYMLGLALFRSFSGVALTGFAGRVAGTLILTVLGQLGAHGLKLGFRAASLDEIKAMAKPALSFMSLSLANALSFQGVTLVVGALAGPAAVALFNTYRTISRVAVQVTGLFSHALWPEFSRLYGEGGMAACAPLFRRSALLSAAQAAGFSVVLYFAAPYLLEVWTHGRLAFVPSLMAWLLAYAAVGGAWHVPRILLLATNTHVGLAGWSLVAGALAVGLAWLLGLWLPVDGPAVAMLVSEGFIALICVFIARRALIEAGPSAPAKTSS